MIGSRAAVELREVDLHDEDAAWAKNAIGNYPAFPPESLYREADRRDGYAREPSKFGQREAAVAFRVAGFGDAHQNREFAAAAGKVRPHLVCQFRAHSTPP